MLQPISVCQVILCIVGIVVLHALSTESSVLRGCQVCIASALGGWIGSDYLAVPTVVQVISGVLLQRTQLTRTTMVIRPWCGHPGCTAFILEAPSAVLTLGLYVMINRAALSGGRRETLLVLRLGRHQMNRGISKGIGEEAVVKGLRCCHALAWIGVQEAAYEVSKSGLEAG
jgi:hypothetical protein